MAGGKVMRSVKEGSLCAELTCQKPIAIGDPIVYFGPRFVFGLTCHTNEKTTRYLKQLTEQEAAQETITKQTELSVKTIEALKFYRTRQEDAEFDTYQFLDELCELWGVKRAV